VSKKSSDWLRGKPSVPAREEETFPTVTWSDRCQISRGRID
jgi:hypothetical protein